MTNILHERLAHTLAATDFPSLGEKYEGKVRDCYVDAATGRRTIIVTDRLSAFDQIVGTIPFKGQVLNQIAQHWFEQTADIAPNHVLAVPDPNVMVGTECVPLRAEFVMRGYLTGVTSTSIWRAYERGERTFCGHALADGMRKNERLREPILTPSTKAEKGDHDVSVSKDQLLAMGAVTPEHFERAEAIAYALFARGQKLSAERGLILVDTKYEMGLSPDGDIVVIDEIHTPDSSRYWFAEDYEARFSRGEEPRSLDKELVRRHLAEEHGYVGDGPPPPLSDAIRIAAAERYIEIFELCTGRTFVPDASEDPAARIAANLEVPGHAR
ncbi:MAG TPA: phosphoribosylaminoimidazolesuccinocarboxamide synthase [Kofleriaceae bacterium]|nr:phosphoribosylaminoimidazolesuccinocarboxamide synthase [Kofleriaceae bacterium]